MRPVPRWVRHAMPALAGLALVAVVLSWPGLRGGEVDEAAGPTSTRADGSAPTTSAVSDPAADCISSWPLRRQVGQLVAIAIDGGALPTEAERVADLGVGGVLLQRPAADGLAAGIDTVKRASAIPPLVMVDEEGGEV